MKFAILIPTFQAEKTLPTLLTNIIRVTSTIEDEISTIVVNDGSTDNTAEVARNFSVTLINHEKNKGKGSSLLTGFNYALQKNVDAVLTIDADLQHDPIFIKNFISEFKKGEFDIILGNRVNRFPQMPLHRQLSNILTSYLLSSKLGIEIPDSQSGYRIISSKVINKINLYNSGFMLETELLIEAAKLKFKITSIPISTIYSGEKSFMRNTKSIFEFIKLLSKE